MQSALSRAYFTGISVIYSREEMIILIKFESKKMAPFIMQSEIANTLLAKMGHRGKLEGSISGAAITDALARLEVALSEPEVPAIDPDDEDEEREHVSPRARATPLLEMLRHASANDSYVMWRPE